MKTNKKDVFDIVTKIIDSEYDDENIAYIARTVITYVMGDEDEDNVIIEIAKGSSRQEAGEKSLFMALDKEGLSIEDIKSFSFDLPSLSKQQKVFMESSNQKN
jgi:beta-N-acetylglucosaminidase